VNVAPTAKIAALKSHTVDIISDFYNEHDLKVIEFCMTSATSTGRISASIPTAILIVNGAYLEKNPNLAGSCADQPEGIRPAADVAPCLKALLDQVSGLDRKPAAAWSASNS
jgi:NitT/TauT family transport system substrate-binding protein